MYRRPPRATRTSTLLPHTTLVRSLATWVHRLFRQLARNHRERVAISASAASSRGIRTGVFHYILRHTRRSQFFLLATALVALPLLYAGLELSKLIITNAIRSEEHTYELQPLMLIAYAVSCL